MIRRARLNDIPAIVALAVESVSNDPLPVKIDMDAILDSARTLIAGEQHFAWVSEVDGKITGAVGALTQASFWHERKTSSVMMFYAKSGGVELLREYARWVKSRPVIKIAVFSLERNADPRIEKLLMRLGFTVKNTCLSFVRGIS